MDTVQAAILLSKFEVFETETASRNRIAKVYSSQISDFYRNLWFLKIVVLPGLSILFDQVIEIIL